MKESIPLTRKQALAALNSRDCPSSCPRRKGAMQVYETEGNARVTCIAQDCDLVVDLDTVEITFDRKHE